MNYSFIIMNQSEFSFSYRCQLLNVLLVLFLDVCVSLTCEFMCLQHQLRGIFARGSVKTSKSKTFGRRAVAWESINKTGQEPSACAINTMHTHEQLASLL